MKISYSNRFLNETKVLSKRYRKIKADIKQAIEEIVTKNDMGISLGSNLFKKRVKNSSIPISKSGGFRVILYKVIENQIIMMSIYSKTDKESLSDIELSNIIEEYYNK